LRKEQLTLDPKQLIFIDETAATTKMTRLYGRAPQGKRLVDKVPHGHWKTEVAPMRGTTGQLS
jgi:hypothetical protein